MQPNIDKITEYCQDCGADMRYVGQFIESEGCVCAWHCDHCDAEQTRPCEEFDREEP